MLKYYPTKVNLWMELDDKEVPIQSVTVKYGMNYVPICRIEFSAGSLVTDTSIKSAVHEIAEQLREGKNIRVMCSLSGTAGTLAGDEVEWPGHKKAFCIFDGYLLSAIPEKGPGIKIAVGGANWLERLERTSWTNSVVSSASPAGTLQNALYASNDPISSTVPFLDTQLRSFVGGTSKYDEDMWKVALKPFLLKATSKNPEDANLNHREQSYLRDLYGEFPPNVAGNEALQRMDDGKYIKYRPLPLFPNTLISGVSAEMRASFLDTVGRIIFSDAQTPTLWNKLLAFSQLTMFPLIPLVETASFVPWVPTSNKVWLTLDDNDIWRISCRVILPRKFRGVILLGARNQPIASPLLKNIPGILGFYDIGQMVSGIAEEELGENLGSLLVMNSPEWLKIRQLVTQNLQDYGSTIKYGINTAGQGRRVVKNVEDEVKKSFASNMDVGNKFAKAIYMSEAFKEKTATVTTRLRFDIAPGSHIRLKGSNEKFNVPGYTSEGLQASVESVSINVSATGSACYTELELSHVRTENEKSFFIEEHPISGNLWYGGPLTHVDGVTPDLV